MSDDDRDIDIESDAEKRAHHNALERKRRDHIKDSFSSLRDCVPALQGEKVASRAQILKKAAEYIQYMRRKNTSHQQDIDDLKKQNSILENQISEVLTNENIPNNIHLRAEKLGFIDGEVRSLEKASFAGFTEACEVKTESVDMSTYNDTESESSDSETGQAIRQPKKLKMAGLHH
ncbi:protein max isoform X2 [Cardiocondyla obscurior]|uniref:protein max isoform X2 n=1 Tax=Cardiocondyla obscurior TaxID=286306 RepID=UPI00396579EB